ncbi:MAG: flavodoxin [Firmicutes bacterium]|nr:flavodoxin [Bacillota bacterium]
MNIGIIVYSQTGNTRTVAEELKKKLDHNGHTVKIEQITITGDASPRTKNVQFKNMPIPDLYDALVFASPVQAFSLTSIMTSYLQQLSPLQDKKVACFVTKQLPGKWTGGNQAVATMKKICQSKGATVSGTGIVIWSKSGREQNINQCIEDLSNLF